jgi:chorismate lyase
MEKAATLSTTWFQDEDRRPDAQLIWLKKEILQNPSLLTHYLKKLTDNKIEFVLKYNHWGEATLHELEQLGCEKHQKRCWIREITWSYQGQVWITGRTVIPVTSLFGEGKVLSELGSRPLGCMFSSHPHFKREKMKISAAAENAQIRQSLFILYNKPLLVSEVFFENFFSYVMKTSA